MLPLYKKLLREWKRISHDRSKKYFIRPQESNLQVWNMVLLHEKFDLKLCCVVYIGHRPLDEHTIVVFFKCLTPSAFIPVNKTICLNQLAHILSDFGLCSFYKHLSDMVFGHQQPFTISESRMAQAWNRVMLKDFTSSFPDLFECEQIRAEDHKLVAAYLQQSSPSYIKLSTKASSIQLSNKESSPKHLSEESFFGKRQRTDMNAFINTESSNSENSLHMCDDYEVLENRKRRR